jgi:hypothetical protein
MNIEFHNLLNSMKSSSSKDRPDDPMTQTVVRGTPESNRAIIDMTRDKKQRAFMEKNTDDVQQLYLHDYGFLKPWDIVTIHRDGSVTAEPFQSK